MQLHIPYEIWQEIHALATLSAPNEITGLGTIQSIDGSFYVKRIFVPQQLVNPGYCETAEGALNEIISNLLESNAEEVANLRFRWHSHADNGVFWSTTDEHDISSWEGPWVVNLVVNAAGDYLARLDVLQDIRISNIPLDIRIDIETFPRKLLEHCASEIRQKVRHDPFIFHKEPVGEFTPSTLAFLKTATKGSESNET